MKSSIISALLLSVLINISFSATQLNGAGASFPYPIYSNWFLKYQQSHKDVRFNYRPIGSGGGIRQLIAGTVDFGASDVPLKPKERKKLKYPVIQVPMVIGAVVVTFNLGSDAPENLILDGSTIADIYLGKISKWNDPAILALNPGVKLPDLGIMVVRRADSSGTTAIFTKYLSSVSSDWKSSVGAGKSVKWKLGFGGKGNDGVTGIVKQTKGALGYVELAYALNSKLSYAHLKNSSGRVIEPKIENVSIAAQSLVSKLGPDDELIGDISNSNEATAYPIASMTYLLLPQLAAKIESDLQLRKFIQWAYANGDSQAVKLHYAPLPDKLKTLVLNKLGLIKKPEVKANKDAAISIQ